MSESQNLNKFLFAFSEKLTQLAGYVNHFAKGLGNADQKKKKDPNAPKKPLSAYLIFSIARQSHIKAKNPTATFTEISKIVGDEWKNLSEEKKKKFQKKEEESKREYAIKIAGYNKASVSKEETQTKAQKKAEKLETKEVNKVNKIKQEIQAEQSKEHKSDKQKEANHGADKIVEKEEKKSKNQAKVTIIKIEDQANDSPKKQPKGQKEKATAETNKKTLKVKKPINSDSDSSDSEQASLKKKKKI